MLFNLCLVFVHNKKHCLDILSKVFSKLTCQYDIFISIGEFDLTVNKKALECFKQIQFRKLNR